MGLFTKRVKRIGTDRYRLSLPAEEADLLRALLPQLRGLLATGLSDNDPSLTRLFPTAYANDPELDAGYQALVRDELLEKRFASLDVIDELLGESDEGPVASEVDGEALSAWMRAVNDLRLVLGTRLDVSEDDDPSDIDPSDPEAQAWAIYHYLGMLVSFIVDALADDL